MAIILLVGYFYQQNRPIEVKGYLVTKKDITETIVATGRVDLGNRINMAFQVGGIIGQLFIQEGQQVKAGGPLIELEDSAEKNRLELAKVNYDLALVNMKSKENEVIASAREQYNQAKINSQALYDRYLKLYSLVSIGGSSQNDVNNARNEWELAFSRSHQPKLNWTVYYREEQQAMKLKPELNWHGCKYVKLKLILSKNPSVTNRCDCIFYSKTKENMSIPEKLLSRLVRQWDSWLPISMKKNMKRSRLA